MDDLREDYNVTEKKKFSFDSEKWWQSNKGIFRILLILSVISFIIIKPDMIGKYIGIWLGNLINSFSSSVNVVTDQWYVILITLISFSICYFLFQRSRKN